jgi:hypothetical protein
MINRPIVPGEKLWLLDRDEADHVQQYSLVERVVESECYGGLLLAGGDDRLPPKDWFFETRTAALEEWKQMTESEIADLERHSLFLGNELWGMKK